MATDSWVCANCGKLNGGADRRCFRCQVPKGLSRSVTSVARALGPEPATRGAVLTAVGVYGVLLLVSGLGAVLGGVNPRWALRLGALSGDLGQLQPWRYLTATFVHFSAVHLLFNASALHGLGRNLERIFGPARLLCVLLLSSAGGFVLSALWSVHQPTTGGLSAGIFGFMGIEIGWCLARRDPAWKRAALNGVGYVVLMILLGPMFGMGINHAAHAGGLISGAGLGALLFATRSNPRWELIWRYSAWALGGITGVGILLSLFF
jgi:rhomboid protease GluP